MDSARSESVSPSLEIVSYPGCLSCASRSEEEALTIDNALLSERDILTLLFVLLEKSKLNFDIKLIDHEVQFDRSRYTTDIPNVIIIPSYYLHVEDTKVFKSSLEVLVKSQFLNAPFTRSREQVAPFIMFLMIESSASALTQTPSSSSADSKTGQSGDSAGESYWSIICLTCHNVYEPINVFFINPLNHKSKVSTFSELSQSFPEQVRSRLKQTITLFLGAQIDLETHQVFHVSLFKQRDEFNGGIIAALDIAWILKENGRLSEADSGTGLLDYEEQRTIDEARSWLGYTYRSRIREKRKRSTRCYDFEEDEVINFESILPEPEGLSNASTVSDAKSSTNSSRSNKNGWTPIAKHTKARPNETQKPPSSGSTTKRERNSSNTKTAVGNSSQQISRYLSPDVRDRIATIFEMLSIENVVKKDVFPIFPPLSSPSAPQSNRFSAVKVLLNVGSREGLENDPVVNGTSLADGTNAKSAIQEQGNADRAPGDPVLASFSPESATPPVTLSTPRSEPVNPSIELLRLVSDYVQNFDFLANFCPEEVKFFTSEELDDLRSHFLKKVAFPSVFFQTLLEANEKNSVTKEVILFGIRKTIESIKIPKSFVPDKTLEGLLALFGKTNIKDLFLMDCAMTYETTKLGRNKKLLCKYRDPLHFDRSSGVLELKYRKGDTNDSKATTNDSNNSNNNPDVGPSASAGASNTGTGGKSNNSNAGNLRQGELVVSALDINTVGDYALEMFDNREIPKPSKYVPQALQSLARQKYYTTTKALMKVFNNHFTRNGPPARKKRLLEQMEEDMKAKKNKVVSVPVSKPVVS